MLIVIKINVSLHILANKSLASEAFAGWTAALPPLSREKVARVSDPLNTFYLAEQVKMLAAKSSIPGTWSKNRLSPAVL